MRIEVHMYGEKFKSWEIADPDDPDKQPTSRAMHLKRVELISWQLSIAQRVMAPLLSKTLAKAVYYVYFTSKEVDDSETDF